MRHFDKYKNSPDPKVRERAANWGIAIGLQAVDNLTVSDYLIELAKLNIEGKISNAEVQRRIHEYNNKKQ
jgi:hypothetical protein